MIQPSTHSTIQSNVEVKKFDIEFNETMLDMIVNKVYTDKVLAVIREWSTNAVDACIAANKPIKFTAHLPTHLKPYFIVRDYGTGLSEEDVVGLYSTFWASTKRTSNAFNGTFGIGRAAGLAYASSFDVISYFNGKKYAYSVSIDKGWPVMIPLGITDTDEPNGLEISVPVKRKDIAEFEQKAVDVYRWFDTKPETNIKLHYPEPEKIIDGDNWYISKGYHRDRYQNVPLVIMGNVAYVIDKSHFFNDFAGANLLDTSLRLNVPLGAVAITPGRESLSMDESTTKYLKKLIITASADIADLLDKTLNKYKTNWEKLVKYNEISSTLPHQILKGVNWMPKDVKYITHTNPWSATQLGLLPREFPSDLVIFSYRQGQHAGENIAHRSSVHINSKMTFMIADITTGHNIAAQNYAKHVMLIKMRKPTKAGLANFITLAKKFIEDIGSPDYVLASDHYNAPTRKARTAGTAITATSFAPLLPNIHGKLTFYRGALIPPSDTTTFFYCEMTGFKLQSLAEDYVKAAVAYVISYNAQNKDSNIRVIGVPKGAMPNIKKDPRFIPLSEGMKKIDKKLVIADMSALHQAQSLFSTGSIALLNRWMNALADGKVKSALAEVLNFQKKYDTNPPREFELVTKFFTPVVSTPKLEHSFEDLEEIYPEIKCYTSWYGYDTTRVESLNRYMMLEDHYRKSITGDKQ